MFYVLNNREAKVTDAIFLVILENVTQIYLILYLLQRAGCRIKFRICYILADAVKEMFLLCIIAANFWLTHRTG